VTISKILLLVVALVAAYVTLLRPGDILFMVGAAFSLAASAFFPALVLGVFWKRANQAGALAGMIVGIGVCAWYMGTRYEFFQRVFGLEAAAWPLWFGIQPISSGVFGMPVGLLTLVVVSLITPTTDAATRRFVDNIRFPRLQD
jgi:cation/acetate symporter